MSGSTEGEPKPAKGRSAARIKRPTFRSKTGNGKMLLAGIDQRTLPYREFQDIVADLTCHMGTDPSAVQQAMIEEAAGLILWCRQARRALLTGEGKFGIAEYCTAVNSLRRMMQDLGQERRMLDITPNLPAYLAQKKSRSDGGRGGK
jgi:hypothetical protein